MSGPVVSNAGPLMALAKLNLLHLLKELYGCVHFTLSVYEETVVEGMRQGHEDARTLLLFLDQMEWGPHEVEPAEMPAEFREARLDRGERGTLALAMSLNSSLVLMDETVGRQIARDQGLTVRGSLGVLIEATNWVLSRPISCACTLRRWHAGRTSGSTTPWWNACCRACLETERDSQPPVDGRSRIHRARSGSLAGSLVFLS